MRAARHVFGAEPSDVELCTTSDSRRGPHRPSRLSPVPAPVGGLSSIPNPKRAAPAGRQGALRARPSTAAQAALAAAREGDRDLRPRPGAGGVDRRRRGPGRAVAGRAVTAVSRDVKPGGFRKSRR